MLTTTVTVHDLHKNAVLELLKTTLINIINVTDKVIDETSLVHVELPAPTGRSRIILDGVFNQLRKRNISYSHVWCKTNEAPSGESHFRSYGPGAQQLLSWSEGEKDVVSTELVRQAIAQGDTAVYELLDETEMQFVPWKWNDVIQDIPTHTD